MDGTGWPCAVVPASCLVQLLTRAHRERLLHHRRTSQALAGVTVASWLPQEALPALVVGPRATALQVGTAMARTGSPLAVVAEGDDAGRRVCGVITADRLLEALSMEGERRSR
ncbi:hypothetical protein [Streptomyces seoulensis]|uniref:hypothetical protein n=1 Tax=Streptomyces seoulensis TaxID=73044 RepID=UPI002445F662|nr:hypothetical protein [Streptomyces seoulensis]